jgi:PTH1 family peptidyl-tRNA hydrolase
VTDESIRQCLVVGLGNPGKKYELTRHNVGRLVVERLAHFLGWSFVEEKKFHGWAARSQFEGGILHLLQPTTYMNESGRSVRAYLDYFKLTAGNLIVVSDDVELPFGTLRFRPNGGTGGHNGLKSVEAHVGTQEYRRLKMGVGKDTQGESLADYVLSGFKPEELLLLPAFVDKGVEVLRTCFKSSDRRFGTGS